MNAPSPLARWLVFGIALAVAGCRPASEQTHAPAAPSPSPQMFRPNPAQPATFPVTLTDFRGKTLTLNAPPQRIVSLAPSNTEILYALNAGPQIDADTTACDYPPEAKTKPHIGGFQIDIEAVESHNPDLVVAVGSVNQKAIDALDKAQIPLLDINPKTIAQTYDAIRLLGQATGKTAQAEQIITQMRADIESVRRAVSTSPNRPGVLMIHGLTPQIYTTGTGTVIDDLITIAGGKNIVTAPSPAGDTISAEQVVALKPDVIVTSEDMAAQIKRVPGWSSGVPAVQNNKFFVPTDAALISRACPRLAQGAKELAYFLHPEISHPGGP